MITIDNNHDYQDFKGFISDPAVKILNQYKDNQYTVYSFNTGETIAVSNSLIPEETKYDRLIFGKDQTENVVNVSVVDGKVQIYTEKNGTVTKIEKDYLPWVLTSKPVSRRHQRLKGNQYYKYINFMDYKDYLEFTSKWQNDVYTPRTIEEGYMLLHGVTYFKDMDTSSPSILSFDIETLSLDPNAEDAGVVLITNTLRNSKGISRKLFSIKDYDSDHDMISDWCNWVRKNDPSIMVGHNIFGFDLDYLDVRGGGLSLGRDGSEMQRSPRPWKFRKDGSQQYSFTNMRINGREIIDTFFLSIKFDIGRKFPSYGLKPIIEYLGMEKTDRIKWDFDKWSVKKTLSDDKMWTDFCSYAIDDSDDSLKLYDHMIAAFFYLNQSIPKSFQHMINEATGSQVDSFMIRSYLQDGYSQPKSSDKVAFQGAISFGIPGNYQNVFSVDFHALYPSIIRQYKLYDKNKDPKSNFLKATEYFAQARVKYKKQFKDTGDIRFDGMQSAAKVFVNSLYGATGSGYLLYNSPKIAEYITSKGRELLDTICQTATGKSVYIWREILDKKMGKYDE